MCAASVPIQQNKYFGVCSSACPIIVQKAPPRPVPTPSDRGAADGRCGVRRDASDAGVAG